MLNRLFAALVKIHNARSVKITGHRECRGSRKAEIKCLPSRV